MSLREVVLTAAETWGVNRVFLASRWRRRHLLILCYHGFALQDEHYWDPELFLSAATFRARLEHLKRTRCTVLSLAEGLHRLQEGSLPERAVAITVDDGLYDFFAVGYPLLKEFAVPATVYVATYYVERQLPVFDVMASYLLWRAARAGHGALPLQPLGGEPQPVAEPAARNRTWQRLKTAVAAAALTAEGKDAVLSQIAAMAGIDYGQLREARLLSLMRPAELENLDPELVDLQLHTHRHRLPDDRGGLLHEIEENRASLAAVGRSPSRLVHFCYPSGQYRPEVLPWLREAGVVSATTCDPGIAKRQDPSLLLPRFIDTERTTSAEFAAWVSGLRGLMNRRALGLG